MTSEYVIRDSGTREVFDSGMVRDCRRGKGRFDLLPGVCVRRLAQLYERGAVKYDARNWEKGQAFSRAMDSLLRHAFQYLDGERSEDHLAAVVFNAFAIMFYEEEIAKGALPAELNDVAVHSQKQTELPAVFCGWSD